MHEASFGRNYDQVLNSPSLDPVMTATSIITMMVPAIVILSMMMTVVVAFCVWIILQCPRSQRLNSIVGRSGYATIKQTTFPAVVSLHHYAASASSSSSNSSPHEIPCCPRHSLSLLITMIRKKRLPRSVEAASSLYKRLLCQGLLMCQITRIFLLFLESLSSHLRPYV